MSTRGFVDSPTFYPNVELSATDLNDIANNLMILQGAARRKYNTHYIHRTRGFIAETGRAGEIVEGNWLWRGGFQYRVGLTTARFVIVHDATVDGAELNSSHTLGIYFNDVLVASYPANINSTVVTDVDITDKGYTDWQVITVLIRIDTNDADQRAKITGEVYVKDAYTFPYASINVGTNPTLTNFGQLTATRLNDLSNKVDYLMRRMAQVPIIPHHAFLMFQLIGWGSWTQHWLSVLINFGNDATHLRLKVRWISYSPGTYIQIRMNGVTKQYGPYTGGQTWPSNDEIVIPMSDFGAVANTDYLMSLYQVVTLDQRGPRNDRLVLRSIDVINPSESGVTDLAVNTPLTNITFSALQTRLNTYVSVANAIETKLNTNANVWTRGRMFRARMAMDDFQNEYWKDEQAHYMVRTGDVLWVKGKNVKLAYGPAAVKPIKGDEEEVEITWEYEQSLTSGNVETKVFYLDQFEALYPGTEYFILGDVHFAAEYLR